jgi:serine/threonine protein kinase
VTTFTSGQLLEDRYEILARIARGGMAEIWDGFDIHLQRSVAIKVAMPEVISDAELFTRFRNEAQVAARLSHKNIVETFDAGTTAIGDLLVPFIVMERIHGVTLREFMNREHISDEDVRQIGYQLSDALEYAHESGFLHGDIKPTNILIANRTGRTLQSFLTDFGLTTSTTNNTKTKKIPGSAAYAAPELLRGEAPTKQSDIYSLGAVLYELVTHVSPLLQTTEAETIEVRKSQPTPPLRQLQPYANESLAEIIDKAIAFEPSTRFLSAELMKSSLGFAKHEDVLTREEASKTPRQNPRINKPRHRTQKKPMLIFGTFVLFAVALIVVVANTGGFLNLNSPEAKANNNPIVVHAVTAYDPFGDQQEHDSQLPNLIDNNPNTTWSTDRYNSESFGGLKSGVGVELHFSSTQVSKIQISNISSDAQIQIYVAQDEPNRFEGWQTPLASTTTSENVNLNITPTQGSVLLIWITKLSPTRTVSIGEVRLTG